MSVLVTAFEPFGGHRLNSSLEAARALPRSKLAGAAVSKATLPVVFGEAIDVLADEVRRVDPDVVVVLGQTDGGQIALERVALNLNSTNFCDGEGTPAEAPIVADGPTAYWSTLPLQRILHALREVAIPATLSSDAGGYVCNNAFYGLMHLLATELPGKTGGLVHVPCLPEQVLGTGLPSMSRGMLTKALETIITTTTT